MIPKISGFPEHSSAPRSLLITYPQDVLLLQMAASGKQLINLFRGWPSPHLLPISNVRDAVIDVLDWEDRAVPALLYGPDPGYPPLRKYTADWLSEFYQTPSVAERICITGGASQSLAAILQAYTDPHYTQYIWMVCPSYFSACQMFIDAGFINRLRAVPEDEEGIDIAYLQEGLRSCCLYSFTNDESVS